MIKHAWLVAAVVAAISSIFIIFLAYEDMSNVTGFAIRDVNDISPADRIKENQIRAAGNSVVINLPNAVIGSFSNTKSMNPTIDDTANVILVKPDVESDIKIGDIISYYSEEAQGLVSHRVVKISSGEYGWYALAKGDNSEMIDPEKIKFEQVKYVVVGIIY